MLKFPMEFTVTAASDAGIGSNWQTKAPWGGDPVAVAIPPEFEGPGGGYSPEDLYAMALANCFVATFKVFAEKSKLNYEKVEVSLKLKVDRDEKGMPWMARADLNIVVYRPDTREKAEALIQKTQKGCLVLNSVKTEKHFTYQIIS